MNLLVLTRNQLGETIMIITALILAVLLHTLLGVKIARFSREVRDQWYKDNDKSAASDMSARFLLYPMNSFYKLGGDRQEWMTMDFQDTDLYAVLHGFFWEIRIAWNFFVILGMTALFCIVGIINLLVDSVKKACS